MISVPAPSTPTDPKVTRAAGLRRMIFEVEEELGLAECDVESSFLCHELVEFRGYLLDELRDLTDSSSPASR